MEKVLKWRSSRFQQTGGFIPFWERKPSTLVGCIPKMAETDPKRYYSDGWILRYKVDSNGNSIPSSFQWIKKG